MRYASFRMVKLFRQFKNVSYIPLILLVSVLLLSSCADRVVSTKEQSSKELSKEVLEPIVATNEVLKDLHVRVPETILSGEAFEIRVTTIGSLGTKPFYEEDSLQLDLVSSVGQLEPSQLTLQGGIGSIQLSLSEIDSAIKTATITVSTKDLNQNLISAENTLNIQ